jgi:hypothetical protein
LYIYTTFERKKIYNDEFKDIVLSSEIDCRKDLFMFGVSGKGLKLYWPEKKQMPTRHIWKQTQGENAFYRTEYGR